MLNSFLLLQDSLKYMIQKDDTLEHISAVHVVLFYITPVAVFILTSREGLRHPYTYMNKNTHINWDSMYL